MNNQQGDPYGQEKDTRQYGGKINEGQNLWRTRKNGRSARNCKGRRVARRIGSMYADKRSVNRYWYGHARGVVVGVNARCVRWSMQGEDGDALSPK